jgi:Fur family ferric uptake transcriptional regulator
MSGGFQRRNTRQRQVVLDELRKLHSHPTAAELYEFARQRLPKISLGTVYRNLEILTLEGVVRRLDSVGAEARFDGDVEDHHHVRCVRCGAVGDVHGLPHGMEPVNVSRLGDYEILGYRLQFEGICPLCRDSQNSAGGNADTKAG